LKLDIEKVCRAMAFDKKIKQGRIRVILLEKLGQATIRDDVPDTLIREALETLK
jgi:3-dehydroquinate synthetase